ncbi:SQS1 [Symbiodinium sp. KB8]|nr:SQS1 [Symbiodinium sp. KB8]
MAAHQSSDVSRPRRIALVGNSGRSLARPNLRCCAVFEGADADQIKMMEERVILVDEDDNVVGAASKKDCEAPFELASRPHLMENIDKGMLHRAFSVFLFTPDGRLLLQKVSSAIGNIPVAVGPAVRLATHAPLPLSLPRAPTLFRPVQRSEAKITFPGFWANTCCSHPLSTPLELEERDAMGVKRAARRKMEQELGINPDEVPLSSFRYLTRIHYVAGCGDGVWGEHEIDHILVCTPPTVPVVRPNDNEVAEARWFTAPELSAFVRDALEGRSEEKISPWFGIIENTLLHPWWEALARGTLADHVDAVTIHRADDLPTASAARAAEGRAEPAARPTAASAALPDGGSHTGSDGDASKKQGAYGKVKVHSEGTLSQLCRFDEVAIAAAYKLGLSKAAAVESLPDSTSADYLWCEEMLCKTSRSFALVIQQLPLPLRKAICIFYLVLRGLDTVEDDMTTYIGREAEKLDTLRGFWRRLDDPTFHIDGVGEADERVLLERFSSVNTAGGTESSAEYNLYCHFVAGLVGEGLSRLFAADGYESPSVAANTALSNDMGLFLQKTNIIRDYLEDLVEGRAFWPRDIWGDYAPSLSAVRDSPRSLECLNHMISDALQHAPHCLRYLESLRDPDVFRFCAIPQLMAIATLEKLANNPDVFTGVVKIRKGLALKLISGCDDMTFVYDTFLGLTRAVTAKIPADHTVASTAAAAALEDVEAVALPRLPASSLEALFSVRTMLAVLAVFGVTLSHLYSRSAFWEDGLASVPRITDKWDVLVLCVMVVCILYCFAFLGLPVILFGANRAPAPGSGKAVPESSLETLGADAAGPVSASSTPACSPAVAALLKQRSEEAARGKPTEAELRAEGEMAATEARRRATAH